MKAHIRTSTFIAAFLLVGLIFAFVSANVALGGTPQILGCCFTENDGGSCVGCPEGAICTSTSGFCESEGGTFGMGSCFNLPQGPDCGLSEAQPGCCVIEPGNCEDVESSQGCFFTQGTFGQLFVAGLSCSEVPQCEIEVVRNIPTMSNWALFALAAVFVLVGIWSITRKKSQV